MSDKPFTYNSAWEDGYRHALAKTGGSTRTLAEALGDVAEDVWVMQTNAEDRLTRAILCSTRAIACSRWTNPCATLWCGGRTTQP